MAEKEPPNQNPIEPGKPFGAKENSHSLPVIPTEVLEKIPSPMRERVIAMMQVSGPMPDPLVQKIDGEHLHKIIDSTDRDSQRRYDSQASQRRYSFAAFVIISAFVVFVIIYFTAIQKYEFLAPILSALVGFAAGFGFGRSRR